MKKDLQHILLMLLILCPTIAMNCGINPRRPVSGEKKDLYKSSEADTAFDAHIYTVWPFGSLEAQRRRRETADALGIPVEKTIDLGGGVTLEMVLIPAGEFMMGGYESVDIIKTTEEVVGLGGGHMELYYENPHEHPQRLVRITKPFYIGKYEVTQSQWKQVMGTTVAEQRDKANTSWPLPGEGPNNPMYYVSWTEAQEFARKAGDGLRLPTEAEWEYACRAGTNTRFYFGNRYSDLDVVGWYAANSGGQTRTVGQKTPNAWGLYDMHGNVWEWCSDWFQYNYLGLETTDSTGPRTGTARVYRGGAWAGDARGCRSAVRGWRSPDFRFYSYGFRVVLPAR